MPRILGYRKPLHLRVQPLKVSLHPKIKSALKEKAEEEGITCSEWITNMVIEKYGIEINFDEESHGNV